MTVTSYPNDQGNPAGAIPVYIAGGPVAAPTLATPVPATLAAGATWSSGVTAASGARAVVVALTTDQPGVLTVTRYADLAGLVPIDAQTNAFGAAGSQSLVVNDGTPFLAFAVSLQNTGASTANLTHAAVITG